MPDIAETAFALAPEQRPYAVSPGEPAGCGPDILLQTAARGCPLRLVAFADPTWLAERIAQLGLKVQLSPFRLAHPPAINDAVLEYVPVTMQHRVTPGELSHHTADYVIEVLALATDYCLQQQCVGLLTGPLHKGLINNAGITFSGHTEWLAQYTGVANFLMLMVAGELRVALVTTHLALQQVPGVINQGMLESKINLLHDGLVKLFNLSDAVIGVCGLNPHAGDGGSFGREEIDIISPAIDAGIAAGINIEGPLAADTIFSSQGRQRFAAILAMYHDQGLAPFKALSFGGGVNVTLGLPLLRLSVDHGVGLDYAGTLAADSGSFKSMVALAQQLSHSVSGLSPVSP